ncbi:aquaporin Z [Methylobacterium sp. E-016]|uniref:aquaporin Z n=1 Tax=Methylobacterium sp. E-016 TaxID=2836556 RepID=UPI001FBC0FA6|nr:aquaporin Z [Methylobacterium sp. E-016]MCJ2074311.1 aquaporin Z [Methylobacterium sp. E-016]
MRPYLAEFIGTFVLVFSGCGSAVLAADHIGYAGVALSFGFVLMAMIYALGPISGCHLNPAVTLGLTLSRKFDAARLPSYMAAQVLGAVVAASLLYVVAQGHPGFDVASGFAANGYDAHSPGYYNMTAAFIVEFVLTALLVLTILGATDLKAPVGFAGLAIGAALTVIHLVSIPVTNTSVNPARSIRPALFAGWDAVGQLWLFVLAPLLGGAAAAGLYATMRALDPVVQMPVRQAVQALLAELEQRLEKAGIKPTEF